ncbi:MAG: fatty acid desaturase [Planctomycetota bacterium]
MTATTSSPTASRTSVFAHPGVDWPTLALCAVMWIGLGANLAVALATEPGWGQLAAHALVGVVFLNLSFTIWHEAAHGTVFRSEAGNHVVGVLGAWPAWIPYFLIRRGHRLHHAHVNDPERDPDAWFHCGSIWTLPLRYPAGVKRTKQMVAATDPPAWEGRADSLLTLSILVAMAAVGWFGSIWILLACWVVPKGIAMWIHAWYVNVLPHQGLPNERFLDTRIYTTRWLAWPTVMHSYHGVHHAWQTVPWHRYAKAYAEKREFLAGRGTPIIGDG